MNKFVGLILLLIVACTSSCNNSNTEPGSTARTIGAGGGSVSTADGTGVAIPPAALPVDTAITVQPAPSAPPPSGATVVGTAFNFGPEGTQFSGPVTVTLAFDLNKLPAGVSATQVAIFTAPAGGSNFTSLGGALSDSTHVQASTTHFSVFVAAVASSTPDGGSGSDSGTDGGADGGALKCPVGGESCHYVSGSQCYSNCSEGTDPACHANGATVNGSCPSANLIGCCVGIINNAVAGDCFYAPTDAGPSNCQQGATWQTSAP